MWISRKKYEELEDRIKKLEYLTNDLKRYDLVKMNDVLDYIGRVMEKSKYGEITYSTYEGQIYANSANEYIRENAYTYIYSDFKEYKIYGLYLFNPKFVRDENNKNVIYVEDRKFDTIQTYKYTIDLKNKIYIQTK